MRLFFVCLLLTFIVPASAYGNARLTYPINNEAVKVDRNGSITLFWSTPPDELNYAISLGRANPWADFVYFPDTYETFIDTDTFLPAGSYTWFVDTLSPDFELLTSSSTFRVLFGIWFEDRPLKIDKQEGHTFFSCSAMGNSNTRAKFIITVRKNKRVVWRSKSYDYFSTYGGNAMTYQFMSRPKGIKRNTRLTATCVITSSNKRLKVKKTFRAS